MQLSDIYIYALKELKGFDEEAIEKAILLARNDVVEHIEEFIDFINFNIEDKKFPQITQPIDARIIKKAVDKARNNIGQIVHYVSITTGGYPEKILQSNIGTPSPLWYKGSLKNIERKTIMITGSTSITNNATLASKYYGKLLGAKGYNMLTSFSKGCEQNSISGCIEVSGISTFFLPHSIEILSAEEKKVIQKELETGRCTLISACNSSKANEDSILDTYRYLTAISDCLIVPQLSSDDPVITLVRNFLDANKPVFFIKYKTGNGTEYGFTNLQIQLWVKYLSSKTALQQIIDVIGEAEEI